MRFKQRKTVGLALSGGAARGVAHLGVIKALVDHKIPIDYIAGTSAGSFAGGLFAAGLPINQMIKRVKMLRWLDVAGFHLSRKGVASSEKLQRFIEKLVGTLRLGELQIPFAAQATDILTGATVTITDPEVSLAEAIRASSSFPGIYPPYPLGEHMLIDGGACGNIPVKGVKAMGADIVIAVDVVPNIRIDSVPKNMGLMVDRSLDILLHRYSERISAAADIILTPITEYIHSFDIKKSDHLIALGVCAVEDNIEKIKEVIG